MINGAKEYISNQRVNTPSDSSIQESLPEIAGARFISLDCNH